MNEVRARAASGADVINVVDSPLPIDDAKKIAVGSKSDWSPDGAKLVITKHVSDSIEDPGLEIHDLRTGTIDELAKVGKDPAWSIATNGPIAFLRGPENAKEEVWLIQADGTQARKIAQGGYPHWSGDGKTLYFTDRATKSIMRISPSDPNAASQLFYKAIDALYPVVSPDGSRIASIAPRLGLAVVKSPGGELVKNWPLGDNASGGLVAWHPDGKRLAYGGFARYSTGLWVADLESGKTRMIVAGKAWRPAWSRDGKHFLFAIDDDIYIIDADKLPAP